MIRKLPALLILLLFLLITPSLSQAQRQQDFDAWLAELRSEALAGGISKATLDSALSKVQLIPRVTELDQSQPEFRLTVEEYLNRVVPDSRVLKGREAMEENRDLLNRFTGITAFSPPSWWPFGESRPISAEP
jgi:membrane-bound lytic murein transglycosylase B